MQREHCCRQKGSGQMGEATRVLASYLYDCSQQYPPYTLRIIYLTYFFCEIVCPERQSYLKNLCFLFIFALKKNFGIKYFGKIFIFGRYLRNCRIAATYPSPVPGSNLPQSTNAYDDPNGSPSAATNSCCPFLNLIASSFRIPPPP